MNHAPPWPPHQQAPLETIEESAFVIGIEPQITTRRPTTDLSRAEHTLGKLATHFASCVHQVGWHQTVLEHRGKAHVNLSVHIVPHRAARLLSHLGKRGASITVTTAPWDRARRDAAVLRGPHKSSKGEREFVSEEMLDFCSQGYWIVLPYDAVAEWQNLRVSPLGVIPQRDRRPRLIVDYSYSGVNADTVPLAPRGAMQFGRALQRVLTRIVHANPRYGPVHLAKIDIADGFYRVWLRVDDIPHLGVALPTAPGTTPVIAFPLALPMGWVESPPYFTSFTETACDLANQALHRATATPAQQLHLRTQHRLELLANTDPPEGIVPSSATNVAPLRSANLGGHGRVPPLAAVDVYVNDFLLMAQTAKQREKVMRATLSSIDAIFRPLEASDPPTRKNQLQ